jgi:hypothetical protein
MKVYNNIMALFMGNEEEQAQAEKYLSSVGFAFSDEIEAE